MRPLLRLGLRLFLAAAVAMTVAACFGFLDTDRYWHDPTYAIDRAIRRGGSEDEIAQRIRFEFENYYVEPKTAEGLENYMMKFGDKCETGEIVVCTHRITFSMYVYKYFFEIFLGRSEQSRTEYLVRTSFPKEGNNVIPALGIIVEINHINY
jgi:hypothetical protein